ncbi:DUF2169 family type VI secretion system accessory protein [Izhakiella capsodis]|nr:DUF2169 domain-containing protein [Izhakiella capsodis]
MSDFTNFSLFPALRYEAIDQYDITFHVVAARLTYDINIEEKKGQAHLSLSAKQASLNYGDAHYHDPVRSNVKYESDLAPYKPKTDVIINATAFAPQGKLTHCFPVAVKIGDKIKTLRIHAPRRWVFYPTGWLLEYEKPINQLDILYDYASGGWHEMDDKTHVSPSNPLGIGWYPGEYLKQCKKTSLPAPQIDSDDAPVTRISELIMPEGFGFFGRSWSRRIEWAGTYDDVWKNERHPYLPQDFNFNYWCGAHPSLQITLPSEDNISVELWGLLPADENPHQSISFSIPVETLFTLNKSKLGLSLTKDMQLDTIVIDMWARKVFCTYRIALAELFQPQEIQLRYIAAENRMAQKVLAAEMSKDGTSASYVPVPPSLNNKR